MSRAPALEPLLTMKAHALGMLHVRGVQALRQVQPRHSQTRCMLQTCPAAISHKFPSSLPRRQNCHLPITRLSQLCLWSLYHITTHHMVPRHTTPCRTTKACLTKSQLTASSTTKVSHTCSQAARPHSLYQAVIIQTAKSLSSSSRLCQRCGQSSLTQHCLSSQPPQCLSSQF